MQGDDVRALQDLVESRLAGLQLGCAATTGGEHRHAEGLGDLAHRLAKRAMADDAERRAAEIRDGVIEIAELRRLLPAALDDRLAIGQDRAAQRQHQREGVFGHRVLGVVPDIADGDATRLGFREIDNVGAGGGDGDQLEFCGAGKRLGADRGLVGDHHIGVADALGHFMRGGAGMDHHFMRHGGRADHGFR